jgi:hypothetical protein
MGVNWIGPPALHDATRKFQKTFCARLYTFMDPGKSQNFERQVVLFNGASMKAIT